MTLYCIFFSRMTYYNKIPQATPCGVTLVESFSFASQLVLYIQSFDEKKFVKKNQRPTIKKNFSKGSSDRRVFDNLSFHKK